MRATASEHRDAEEGLKEVTPSELTTIDGGRMNLNQFGGLHHGKHRLPPLGPGGYPLTIYVDGIRVSR
jgi:hypothetical protein